MAPACLTAEFHERIAAATAQSVETIADNFRQRRTMTADEATACGLIDEIIRRHGLRAV